MTVGIYNILDHNGFELPVNRAYEAILDANGIPHRRVHVNDPNFWNVLPQLDLFILRWVHEDSDRQLAHDLLPIIEHEYGVKCYPNQATCSHYDDKIKQYLLLKKNGYPYVKSFIFWDREKALRWADEEAEYPVVFKLRGGAGSTCVWLIHSALAAKRLIRRMFHRGIHTDRLFSWGSVRLSHLKIKSEFRRLGGRVHRIMHQRDATPFWRIHKNYTLFQKFLPNNAYDTRVTVIGGRAFAFRRLVRPNDFRASGSGMIDYDLEKIDLRCVELAQKISREMKFQCMAYDFLMDEDRNPQICEISYTFISKAVRDCSGYWDESMDFHEGHYWPEYFHLVDCMQRPDLKQPQIDY
ncbi:hypothetical protein JXA32_06225 [Candidatus Sumerlaeota bacterium]|nr:hypothetical protein [Candidatus Sumerlaeota bacterium]